MTRPVNPAIEAERFLAALIDKTRAVDESIADAKAGIARSSFGAYKHFADAVADFDGFCILIEYRIKKVEPGPARAALESRLLTERVQAMARMLKASIDLIGALAGQRVFPLGAKDVFLRELRSLYALKNTLAREPFASQLPADTGRDVELAERILHEIIDRAPALLDLTPAHAA